MVNDDLVSMIVPVYCMEPYLRRCVDSLTAQTYQKVEIILVDDGSTDLSGAICDEYAAADDRVRVVHQPNAGVSVARNVGIEAASGRWLAFVDPDDWVDANLVSHLIGIARDANADCRSVRPFQDIRRRHIRRRAGRRRSRTFQR